MKIESLRLPRFALAAVLVAGVSLAGCQSSSHSSSSSGHEAGCLVGTITGAVVGGLIGSTIGGGRGNILATAAGIGIGSYASNQLMCH